MLTHLPRSSMVFLLLVFNLFWTLCFFPFIWKTSSIIFIPKMGKPLDYPASFLLISLSSCVSKLFKRVILSRLLIFLESDSILSPRQAVFRPVRSTLDQILFPSQSIFDGFDKPRPGSWTILSTIDFRKLSTLSGIPPFSINSFRLASLLALLVGLNLSFLISARLRGSSKSQKLLLSSPSTCSTRIRSWPNFFINYLPASLPFSVSCSLFMLTIWPFCFSSHSVPTAVEAIQGALF